MLPNDTASGRTQPEIQKTDQELIDEFAATRGDVRHQSAIRRCESDEPLAHQSDPRVRTQLHLLAVMGGRPGGIVPLRWCDLDDADCNRSGEGGTR